MLGDSTFSNCGELKHVLFSEQSRIEKIGSHCFCATGIEEITIPRSVRTMCANVFSVCKSLRKVSFQAGSRLETVGNHCFSISTLEEVVIPKTLKSAGTWEFHDCNNLRTLFMEEGCGASLSCTELPASARVVFPQEARVWGNPLSELREVKSVSVPDGVEKIGSYLFWGSEVERVIIPASITEIGVEAFSHCRRLKKLVF